MPPAVLPAMRYLEEHGRSAWSADIRRMIVDHHKLTRVDDDAPPLVELFRRGDLVDFSLGWFRCGLSKERVAAVRERFPNAGFHRCHVRRARTCGKKPCWKAVSDRGYAYKNRDGNADGVTKIAFKGGVAGKPLMQLAGKGDSLPLPEPVNGVTYFDTDAAVTVQLHRDDDARCWTSRFAAASVRKNEPAQFKAINR